MTSVAVHPSGKLALSTSKDCSLKMWNLVTGKCAFTTKLKEQGEVVVWSPSAASYATVCNKTLSIHSPSSGEPTMTTSHSVAIHCMCYLKEDVIACGDESGDVKLWNVNTGECLKTLKAHEKRVKAIRTLQDAEYGHLVTVCSDGIVKVWNINSESSLLASASTSARLTCLTCMNLAVSSLPSTTKQTATETEKPPQKNKKRKKNQQ